MELSSVHIKNFRSVKEETITFEHKCRVLVGINESGKTNILRALALLDETRVTTVADKREASKGEDEIEEAHVRFFFKLTPEEYQEICKDLQKVFLASDSSANLISVDGIDYNLEGFVNFKKAFYEADILTSKKQIFYYRIDGKKAKPAARWKKVALNLPPDFKVEVGGQSVSLNAYKYVDTEEYKDIPPENLTSLNAEDDLNALVGSAMTSFVGKNLPPVIYWAYEDSKTLPSKIPLQSFVDDPNTCIPLRRMFELRGIEDIKTSIQDAQKAGGRSLDNLLGRVADSSTKYFHDTWGEYDDISFSLKINGADIETSIQDSSNSFDIEQRSDGFRRFVTFLLVVSARAEADALDDNLLLIDEPEMGLHPSGARYLRDELIDVSATNNVVYSTHSIFMIDNDVIDRHYIVQKQKEITKIKKADASNILEEEVLYQALGHSIYSSLRAKNLIFEGWHDKQLFRVATESKTPSGYAGIKKLFEAAGVCHAHGVKDVKYVSPLFQSGDRKALILTDDDAAAQSNQKEFNANRGYGLWKRYSEILPSCGAVTGEDFVKDSAFTILLSDISKNHAFTVDPTVPDLRAAALSGAGKIATIKGWCLKNGLQGEPLQSALQELKEEIFSNLVASDIEPEYYDYLQAAGTLLASL